MKLSRDHLFTAVFMLVISAVIALVLASANAFFKPMINQNALVAERKAILYVFGADSGGSPDEVLSRFDASVKQDTNAGISVYRQVDAQGRTQGVAIPFSGAGLWGTIEGYLGVSPDLKSVKGIVFTSQNETPGLGGRIDELAYREQFRGLPIQPGAQFAYGQVGGSRIDAITGATQTSKAVLKIINDLMANTVSKMEVK